MIDKAMMAALEADGEKLRAMTGEDHGPVFEPGRLFTRENFEDPDAEAGIFIEHLGTGLVTWVAMQNRSPVTVAEAARAWNTTPEVIREAIAEANWIFITGADSLGPDQQIIELDGA